MRLITHSDKNSISVWVTADRDTSWTIIGTFLERTSWDLRMSAALQDWSLACTVSPAKFDRRQAVQKNAFFAFTYV